MKMVDNFSLENVYVWCNEMLMLASNNYYSLLFSPYYVPRTMLSTLLYGIIYISFTRLTTAL